MNFIYTTIWCLGAATVSLGYSGLYPISKQVHGYIIMSIITFNILYFIKNREFTAGFVAKWEISKLSYQLIVVGSIVSYIIMVPITIRAISIIMSSGWFLLRSYAYSSSSMASAVQIGLYSWFINPLFSATFLIAAVCWFSNSKYKKKLMFLSIIDLILITVTFGGRYNIVKFVLFFLSAYQLNIMYKGNKEKVKIKYWILGFMVAGLLIYLTSLRSLKGLSAVQNIFVYLFGSLVYFDLIIAEGFSPLNSVKLFGNATFGIFTNIPMYIFYKLSGHNFTPEFLIDQTSNDFLYISPGYRYNAFTTWLYPFWKDYGTVGIIVGVAFVCLLFCYLKRRVVLKRTMSSYVLLVYVSYVVLTSTLSYNLITIQQSVTLFLVILLTRRAHWLGWEE